MTGIAELRRAVLLFDNCNESFNTTFTTEELLLIAQAHFDSEWSIPPHKWEELQVEQAFIGIAPQWDDDLNPVYSKEHTC